MIDTYLIVLCAVVFLAGVWAFVVMFLATLVFLAAAGALIAVRAGRKLLNRY